MHSGFQAAQAICLAYTGRFVHGNIHAMGIRNWLRTHLIDHELGVVGGDIEKLETRLEQYNVQAGALRERFERLVNRASMRLARAARNGETISNEDQRILAEIRGGQQQQFGDDDRWS